MLLLTRVGALDTQHLLQSCQCCVSKADTTSFGCHHGLRSMLSVLDTQSNNGCIAGKPNHTLGSQLPVLCYLCCACCRSVSDAGSTPWLAYSTAECVVGLIKWPLDCDPRSSMGLIAHPGEIKGMVLTYDGRRLVTLGEVDTESQHP